jgi:hypothetical protein
MVLEFQMQTEKDPDLEILKPEVDGNQLISEIRKSLAQFDRESEYHQQNDSFLALDSQSYTVVAKIRSPFGTGELVETAGSTNELQQLMNAWLQIQRELGRLVSVRFTITPNIEEQEI